GARCPRRHPRAAEGHDRRAPSACRDTGRRERCAGGPGRCEGGAAASPACAAESETREAAQPPRRVLYRERGLPRYERAIVLPAEVDQAASQAKVENGVLTLTLAKKVTTGARQISVS